MARSVGLALAVLAATMLLHAQAGLASYDTQLYVQKGVYSPGENVTLKGYVYNSSNYSLGFANATVTVSIFNGSGTVSTATFNTTSAGLFYSKSDYYPNARAVPVPPVPGAYKINATYTGPDGTSWSAHSNLTVISTAGNRIDEIHLYPDKTSYYAGTNVSVTAGAYMISGGQKIALSNITVNGTLRTVGDAIRNSFNCTTGTDGTCAMPAVAAPSASGTYVLEANDYVGYSTFKVRPFDLLTTMKDGTGSSIKSVFATGEDAYVEAKVFYNSTKPTGNYTITGYIADANGTRIHTMAGFSLTGSNSYSGKESFRINGSFGTGSFSARLTATKLGGEAVSESATFQIKNWEVSVSKSSTDSGFVAEYDTFGNRTLHFEIIPVDRTTGSVIADLNTTTNITITVENELALPVSNSTSTYNSTCGCYKFNATSPIVTGDYFVKVDVDKSGETQTAYSTITVITSTASASPADGTGVFKEQFGTGEFIYVIPSMSNSTTSFNITDAELISLTGPDGALNYTNASSWMAMNLSDGRLEWAFNSTLGRMRLDPPRNGGQYMLKLYVNNRSASAEVKFTTKPYGICMSPKASSDTSVESDYYRQFKTTDTIYMQVAVKRASDSSSKNTTAGSSSMGAYAGGYAMSGMYYGKGEKCTISTASDQPVSNATLSVLKVTNVESGRDETLNATASICRPLSTSGTYSCTLQSNGTAWEGGMHSVTVSIAGPDGTMDTGYGGFEARNFYIHGWAMSWRNKPESNITLQLYMYAAGSGWFSSGKGLSGTASLEKVEYLGKPGMWMWSSSNYDYNTTGVGTSSISNGQGTMVLNASRAPGGQWSSGSYTAVFKGIDEQGNVDYGRVWFEIRKWDAYAQPVEVQGDSFRYKYDVGTRENVTLYVKISNAGDNWGTSGTSLGGPVTVRVKRLEHTASWPPQEISTSNYTANSITVNVSNPDMWGASASTYSNYAINITKVGGRWSPGGYSVLLDINGTEAGYGWFNIISFGVSAQQVDANGHSTYTSKGRGPLYFNVTATKSTMWSGYYSSADYVNATIDGLSIYTWRSDPATGQWSQSELKYPTDLNIMVVGSPYLNMSGRATINVTYLGGNWPSGWYSGQLTLKNAENDPATGWLGFSIQPFRIDAYNPQYEVSMSAPVNVTLTAMEPDYSSQAVLISNYSITSIVEETWGPSGSTRTQITGFSPTSFNGTSTVLTINPNGGSWTPGWRSLKLTVNDTNTSSTQETWVSFKATAFSISLNRLSGWDIGLGSNVTVNITLREPGTSTDAAGNLTSVFAWDWPSRSTYDFVVGNCNSMTSPTRGCTINGTGTVTILAPSGGWEEKYHYLNFEYAPANGTAVKIEDWQSISFYARPSITAYMNVVDDNLAYRYDGFGKNENVTLWLQSIRDLNGNPLTATILNAQYSMSSSSCWDDSCRTYQNASWAVVNSAGAIVGNDTTGGYVRMYPPSGGWPMGDYYARIQLRSVSEIAMIKNAWFKVVDRSPWNLTISSPSMGQNITSNTIYMSAATTKNARCYMSIYNFDNFNSWYCYSWAGNNTNNTASRPALCNSASGYNGGAYYYSWIDSYNTPGYVTGALSHTYNYTVPADMPNNQHYALYVSCYDSNYMYISSATAFYMNRSASSIIPLWSSQSVNTTTAGRVAGFSLTLRDPVGLSGYVFSTNNSGTWQNDTWVQFPASTNSTTIVVSKTLSSTVGAEVKWAVSFNNTAGNWNSTPNFTLTTTADSVPQWIIGSNFTNTTIAGASANFSVTWTDAAGLAGYVFTINNSDTWVNDTWRPFTGTANNSTAFKILNSTVGRLVQWRVYANNSLNKWSETPIFNLSTTSGTPNWLSGSNTTSTTVAGAPVTLSTSWTDPSGLHCFIFSWNNTGAETNSSSCLSNPSSSATAAFGSGLNSTVGTIVNWRWYANNTLGLWNATPIFNLNTTSPAFPKWLNYSVVGNRANQSSTFSVRWQDPAGIAGYIFSTNNTGSWQNDSWLPVSGNATLVDVSAVKILNSVPGTVSWKFYANNTLGKWNETLNFNFTTVP